MPPSSCVSTPRGLTTTPQSQAITTRSTLTSPFATAASAPGHRLAPVALLDQHIEHLLEVGAVGKQLAPQCHWVLARRVRHLVDEALNEEHVLGVARRAPRAERNVRVLKDRGDAVVREAWRHG